MTIESADRAGADGELSRAEALQRGVQLGPPERRLKLINPRRWRKVMVSVGCYLLECPYCMSTVANRDAADQHLWRLHTGNFGGRAGQFDLLPWVTDLDRRLCVVEDDVAIDGPGNGLERVHDAQAFKMRMKKRRRLFGREWCNYPSAPPEEWQE